MAHERLSDGMIEAGRAFLATLDEYGLKPESAGWLLFPPHDYRFVVASTAVDQFGRRKLYDAILDVFAAHDFGDDLTSFDVHLVSPRERWYAVMKGLMKVEGNSTVYLEDCDFNGVPVNGVIYRFFSPPPRTELPRIVKRFTQNARKAAERA